ncbi:MAG TPA: HAMP domain-containing sensor histidine kinase [Lachnospiraceae bacterium]|nr:HAMP domain-containing sensor histidine kinase [Lachnospiraceae bacterium]
MKQRRKVNVIAITLLIPFLATLIIMCTYGTVKSNISESDQHSLESDTPLNSLIKGNYVLYKKLYEENTGDAILYSDLYINDIEKVLASQSDDQYDITEYKKYLDNFIKNDFETDFSEQIKYFDFYAEDLKTNTFISNTDKSKIDNLDNYCFYIEFDYNENGTPSITKAKSTDSEQLMRNASECILIKNELLADSISSHSGFWDTDLLQEGKSPVSSKFIYAMTQETWEKYLDAMNITNRYGLGSEIYSYYANTGLTGWICLAFIVVLLLMLLLPIHRSNGKLFHEFWYFHVPIEILLTLIFLLCELIPNILCSIIRLLNGDSAELFSSYMKISLQASNIISFIMHGILLTSIYTVAWYIGLSLRSLRELGFKQYMKESSLIYKIFPFCKKHIMQAYDFLEHIDVTKKARRTILKVVILNGIILFLIGILWLGGVMFTIVYSVILYFILKFYVSRMQKKYTIMMDKINEISSGNLNVEIKNDLGIFNPFKEQLLSIQDGFRNAVEEEVRSQKMKSELITNVSHDLKTPLTAIITYLNLLKDENLTVEQRNEYLDTLERKSFRLKVLIEDLFEVSKATSGNVTLHYMDIDICSLIKQVVLEMSDKLTESELEIRMDLPPEKVICSLDSQKTYRIYANLFQNICKYSLPNTRVYVNGTLTEKEIIISLKNISAIEIIVEPTQLTERFIRGDVARNTEGSGLGLAIVKSFVELQGGKFVLENDGDLFKAVTSFPRKI